MQRKGQDSRWGWGKSTALNELLRIAGMVVLDQPSWLFKLELRSYKGFASTSAAGVLGQARGLP